MNREPKLFEITGDELSADEVVGRLVQPAAGAVIAFVGIVRGETDGRQVQYLQYEAYPEMAEETLQQIGAEIRARWSSIQGVAIVHRIGRLEIGEASVVVAVATPHRAAAFDCCRHLMDRVKVSVPVWKKSIGPEGNRWVEGSEYEPGNGRQ